MKPKVQLKIYTKLELRARVLYLMVLEDSHTDDVTNSVKDAA